MTLRYTGPNVISAFSRAIVQPASFVKGAAAGATPPAKASNWRRLLPVVPQSTVTTSEPAKKRAAAIPRFIDSPLPHRT